MKPIVKAQEIQDRGRVCTGKDRRGSYVLLLVELIIEMMLSVIHIAIALHLLLMVVIVVGTHLIRLRVIRRRASP